MNNPLCYDRRVYDLMDVVSLQCNAHQTDVHFRQVIITEDDSHDGDDDLFECFVLFVVHIAVSISAAWQFSNIQRASFAEAWSRAERSKGFGEIGCARLGRWGHAGYR